jgi:GT2 family glycosyltransferase
MTKPRIGVVMITRNRPAVMGTLDRLTNLPDAPPVVVVDNGSTDGTPQLIREHFSNVRLLQLTDNAGSAARNFGVLALDLPYVAFCDDDVWWEPGSLSRAADLLDQHERVAIITGKVLVGDEQAVDPTCLEMAASPLPRLPELPGVPILGFLAGASVVRRRAYLDQGGFERRMMVGGEEQLLALDLARAGWKLLYVDELVAHHHPSPSRDSGRRGWIERRNALWTAWLRRSTRRALKETASTVRAGLRDPTARRALYEAGRGALWALRHRRPIPRSLEHSLDLLEG